MPENETAGRDHMLFACEPGVQSALQRSLRPEVALEPAAKQKLADLAAYWFEAGARDYLSWTNRMVAELGEFVRPHLRKAWISIPTTISSRAAQLESSPLTTQTQRVAVGFKGSELVGIWRESYKALVLSEEDNVFRHPHFCPFCSHEWTCQDRGCILPNEYWCETHAGTQPLPERLDADTHCHFCPNCRSYWDHRYRECLLPEVYECDDHGGVSNVEFLRAAAARNRKQNFWEKASWLRKYAPVIGCIFALLMAAFSYWHYAFYILLRLGVCAVSAYWAMEMFKQQRPLWAWALGANAVLYNPVFRIRMARSDWQIINLIDAMFLAIWMAFSAYGNSGRIARKGLLAFRPQLSERSAGLTPDQYKAEVLAQAPTAVYTRRDAQFAGPEFRKFSKFFKHIDIENGYMDLSQASDEERRDYEEYCKRDAQRPPDETWHFVVLKEQLDSVRQMTTFDAQSVSLGYSSISEDDAWSGAWGKLKIAEDQRRSARFLIVIGLVLFALVIAFSSIWEEFQ